MPSLQLEANLLIQAVLEHLKEQKNYPILASPEDCDFFRKWATLQRASPLENNPTQKISPAIIPKTPPSPKNTPLKNEENFGKNFEALSDADLKNPPFPQEKIHDIEFLPPSSEEKISSPSTKLTSPLPQKIALSPTACNSLSLNEPRPKDRETLKGAKAPSTFGPEELSPEGPGFVMSDDFMDLRAIWTKINSNALLLDILPDDAIAKKIANRWKVKNVVAEISILSYHEPPAQKALLEQIAKAINILLKPTQIVFAEPIEKEKQWEAFLATSHLKYTIACDYTLWQLGGLMQHYKELPSQGNRRLGSIPLFLLPDLSLYLKDPLLKRSLWKALCQTLCS